MSVPTALSSALADRYRVGAQLGAGGMATVYRADDLKHGRAPLRGTPEFARIAARAAERVAQFKA